MGVKYLSEEWAKAVTEALNASDSFKQAAAGQNAKLQQVVTTPDGEVKYSFKLEDGTAGVALGEIEGPEATITQDYETSVKLAKQELTGTAAYMSGKLKVSGDLMRLMQLQGIFNAMPQAVTDVEVEY